MSRTYYRKTTTNAAPSLKPTCTQYGLERKCYGCGRKIVESKEMSLWFVGWPKKGVYGSCCYALAAKA